MKRPTLTAIALAIAFNTPMSAMATLQQQVNEMYGAMINVTTPGVYG